MLKRLTYLHSDSPFALPTLLHENYLPAGRTAYVKSESCGTRAVGGLGKNTGQSLQRRVERTTHAYKGNHDATRR